MEPKNEKETGKIKQYCNGFSIDRHMLPSKIAYFLVFAALGSHMNFLIVFLISVGLNDSEAGFISGMSYTSSAVAGPICGLIADYTGRRKLIFIVLCVGASSSIFALPWVAKAVSHQSHSEGSFSSPRYMIQQRQDNGTAVVTKPSKADLNFYYQETLLTSIAPGASLLSSGYSTPRNSSDKNITFSKKSENSLMPFKSQLFYVMLVMCVVSNLFMLPLISMIDSVVMNIIENRDNEPIFGVQRMFGSIAFGIANLLAGVAIDKYRLPQMSEYTAAYFVFLPFILSFVPFGVILLTQTNWKSVQGEETVSHISDNLIARKRKSMFKALFGELSKIDNVMFLVTVLIVGICKSITISFLFLLMRDEMGNASQTAMGLSSFVSCVSEFLMFPFTMKIMKAFGSPMTSVQMGLIGYVVRMLFISVITNEWICALPQLLHSVCYAVFWAGAVEYVRIISPKEVYVTMFAILTSLYYGTSGLIAIPMGGVFYYKYGGPALYRGIAIVAGIWSTVLFLYFNVRACFRSCSTKAVVNQEEMPLIGCKDVSP